jgi:hypothetical protein
MRFKRPSGATVISLVALFVALSGSAYAAAKITSKDIANGTIKAADLSRGAKKALKGSRGLRGPAGPQGNQGLPGVPGPAGASGITSIVAAQGDGIGIAMAVCPPGTRPVSGGGIEEGTGYLWVNGAARDDATGQSGWLVAGDEFSPVTAFAYCSAGVASFTFPDGSSAKMMKVSQVKAAALKRAAP